MFNTYIIILLNQQREVLQSVKAQYICEDLDNQEDLKKLLIEKYGVNNFSLIDRDILEDHIEELIEENTVKVEPEFFNDDNGKNYKILVKVKGK